MGKRTKVEARSSSPTWETLRDWLRGKIRELMQELLEEEVTEFLSRARYERRAAVDACGYRNGYGKPRKLTTPMGTIEVRRPRVRAGRSGSRAGSSPFCAAHSGGVSAFAGAIPAWAGGRGL